MLEFIFLSPLLAVFVGALIARFAVRRRPFRAVGWVLVAALSIGAFALPLAVGVWIPDFLGTSRTLAATTSPDGHSFRVVQRWNYCDFYTTTFYTTQSDGSATETILDGDAHKSWSVSIALDEPNRIATVTLNDGRTMTTPW